MHAVTATPRHRDWSLRRELTRVLVLTALLPALVFGVLLLGGQWQRERGDMLLRLDANARLSANAFDDFLEGQLAGVRLLADSHQDAADDWNWDLTRLLRTYPAMVRTVVTDRDGRLLNGRERRGALDHSELGQAGDREWFTIPRDRDDAWISDGYRASVIDDTAIVALSAPLTGSGRFDGVLQATIPIEQFVRVRSDNLRLRGYEFLVLDRTQRVVHASEGLRWSALDTTGADGARIHADAVPSARSSTARRMDGLLREDGSAYVDAVRMRNGWAVAVIAPQRNLWMPILPRVALLAALLAITSFGVFLALWRQKRLLLSSLGGLLNSLRGYALGGRLDPARLSQMPEELQPLASGIGELGSRMNDAYTELRHVLAQREQVIAERTESLRHAVSDLDRLSRTDALTGSLNYRGFVETRDALWHEARATGKPLSVLALDIDHFKRYNDLYGHAEGDGALRRFAGAVRSALLHADDVLARPGGEEFVVFLPGSTYEQAAKVGLRVCERVRGADIVHAASPEGRMTVSIGIASMEAADAEPEQMLRRADAALYRAKAAGRNCVSD